MLYLVSAPFGSDLTGIAVIAQGEGLNWTSTTVTAEMLLEKAQKSIKIENVELKALSGNIQAPPPVKDKLIYGETGKTRLWIDTRPMASSRFTSNLAVVVQEIQSVTGTTLGYVVVFPDGRVLKVATADLIKYCEAAKIQGKYALQNMQYVSANGATSAHLKNYEGRTVPVYIQQRTAVNAEKNYKPTPVTPVGSATEPTTQSAANVFTPEQLEVLGRGKNEGVDIRIYANPAYTPKHMNAIRMALVVQNSPKLICDSSIQEDLAAFYGFELAQGADIRPYFNKNYDIKQAVQVKLGIIRGLDVSKYADPSIPGEEMEQLRVRMDADMWSSVVYKDN